MYTTNRGFTLIEMLTVIAIISILAGVVILNVSGARANGRDGQRVTDLGTIELAVELYKDTCGSYPGTITSLSTNTGCPAGTTWGTYIGASVPTKPDGSNYGYVTDGTDFVLYDTMETTPFALSTDLDGTVLGVNCTDPVYCTGS